MNVLKRDYYDVLGLSRDADDDAIQRAFHALARQFHPDVADDPSAEDRFRELAEAYSVLSRREARLLYDRYGYRGRGNQGFDEATWDGRSNGPRAARTYTSRLRSEASRQIRESAVSSATRPQAGARPASDVGSIGSPDPGCEFCAGTGRKQTTLHSEVAELLQVEPCPSCVAGACAECGGSGTLFEERRLRIRIPPMVEDGTLLRIGGEGSDAAGVGSIRGDLLVHADVLSPPRDPRLGRYVAFVLLVVAVATLLLYVLR